MRKLGALLIVIIVAAILLAKGVAGPAEPEKVVLGVERLGESNVASLLTGKRLGLFTNQTGVDSKLRSTVSLVRKDFNLTALFVPEHGLLGAVPAGEAFGDTDYDGIKVFSLYGDSRRPSPKMLEKIDAMVVDIQDIGIRHYTYFSSLAYIMEECAKLDKTVIVLDRPNPLGGTMQGPVLKPEYATFIGLYAIPLRHGLTIGEFARYINKEEGINCKLEVVPMKGWKRDMIWEDTGLPWVITSPQIPTAETAFYYGVTGVSGDSNMSVGIGTSKPFYYLGSTFAKADEVKKAMDELKIPGVAFRAAAYGSRGRVVQGVEIYLEDPRKVNLPELDYLMLTTFRKLYPGKIKFPERGYRLPGYKIDIALGESSLRDGEEPAKAFERWKKECTAFAAKAKPYFLYE